MTDKAKKDVTDMHKATGNGAHFDTFVLDKGIFSNVFDKDIRRVYIYKKAERLAKAIHLITPAFKNSSALREKLDLIGIGLVEGAVLPPMLARTALSRELLALSSVLSIARAGGLLSPMKRTNFSETSAPVKGINPIELRTARRRRLHDSYSAA